MSHNESCNILPSTLIKIANLLESIGMKVFLIGARALLLHGINIGRETRDWNLTITSPFTKDVRDTITNVLRSKGFKVQWRKWGLLVEDDIHVDINYAPLILDEEWIKRSKDICDNVYLPSLEDLVILKLMSGEKKDISDVKRVIAQVKNIDLNYLLKRASEAGLEKELTKILRRMGVRIGA